MTADAAQTLQKLLRDATARCGQEVAAPDGCPEGVEAHIHLLLYSYLLWESRPAAARKALASLYSAVIDLNELRVSLPEEIALMLGTGAGEASLERAARMRATLNDIYSRQHEVSLAHLAASGKREVREYIDSLEGMPPYVAARVTLLGFGGHAVPLDRLLLDRLRSKGAVDGAHDLDEACRWLERHIRASDAVETALTLDAWRDPNARRRARKDRKAGAKGAASAPTKAAPARSKSGKSSKPRTRKGA